LRPHTSLALSAVSLPHEGTSYNPSFEAHQELIATAHEAESKRLKEEAKFSGIKELMISAMGSQSEIEKGVPPGMVVDTNEHAESDGKEGHEGEAMSIKKATKPKTKKQRRKAAILLAEKRARAAQSARKRQLEAITLKTLRTLKAQKEGSEDIRKRPDLPMLDSEQTKRRKLGKYLIPEPRLDVQLGEELSESLRELKPEGSLFRDRFLSMQQRALVEPRVRVIPRRNKLRIKLYEKHPWKRFE